MNLLLILALSFFLMPLNDDELEKARKYVNVSYDKFKDITIYSVVDLDVKCIWCPRQVRVDFFSAYNGATFTRPETIKLQMRRTGENWAFLHPESRGLIILADGKRYNLGTMARDDSKISGNSVYETLSISISTRDLIEMAKAEKLEMQLGGYQFNIQGKYQYRVRAFADKITSGK